MTYTSIAIDEIAPARQIRINREAARNALNPDVMREMIAAFDEAAGDDTVRCIVITGTGDKAFCAGGDLGGSSGDGPIEQHLGRTLLSQLFKKMRGCGKPVIARLNGHALGGGFGLALACDLIVASDDVEMGTPEINIGLWPFIITAVIQRNVPPKLALEMMMLGGRISAEEAKSWSIVKRVVARDGLDDAVRLLVEELAAKSPLILRLGKESFYRAESLAFDDAVAYLESQLAINLMSQDALEGISAFMQKRKPEWKGR